ncbi:hypothetical protein EBQ34_10215 [Vandammella animalimorsus]|uniref:Uncharacterized protein n=1 Tax=Vandammella animalimorsus TaxID=2029117 RepID=A0A3M6R8R8_9BURK|nr:hypothetical protein EBQ34_10215 [Vandammella animalimorsus]
MFDFLVQSRDFFGGVFILSAIRLFIFFERSDDAGILRFQRLVAGVDRIVFLCSRSRTWWRWRVTKLAY